MARLCEGRVAIVTGAGRGIGREHALSLARHGAKVVVNDLGGNVDGTVVDLSPAQSVVDEIRAMGGEAIANDDDVSDWEGSQRMINAAIETFGRMLQTAGNGIQLPGPRGAQAIADPLAEPAWLPASACRSRSSAGRSARRRTATAP